MRSRLLHAILFTPTRRGWGLPTLFEGQPGVAKTEVIEAVADAASLPLVSLSPGLHGEGAFGVVPVPVKTAGGTRLCYPPPAWTDDVEEGGVVFVDEVTSAGPALQAPMLGLVAAKQVGTHTLPERVRVIGACNPPEIAANGQELSAPLANRFLWLSWEPPSVDEHCAFMVGSVSNHGLPEVDAVAEERRVLQAWPTAFARAVGLETAFHRKTGGVYKNKCPRTDSLALGRAWPSDRTWEMATRALASSYVHALSEQDTSDLLIGCVGAEAGGAFEVFIREADFPDIEALLDGAAYTFDPKRIDRTAAVLTACVALVAPASAVRRLPRAEALWRLLGAVPPSSRDLCVPVAKALIDAGLHAMPAAVPVLSGMHQLLQLTRTL